MKKLWHSATANKRRKIIAAITSLALVAASAFAYYVLVVNTTGSGSGTQAAGPNTAQSVNLTLTASWPDAQLAPPGGATGSSPTWLPLTLKADNSTGFAAPVTEIKFTGVSSTDPGCNTVLQNSADGIAVTWPDGTVSGPGAQYAPAQFQNPSGVYKPSGFTLSVPANSTGTNLLQLGGTDTDPAVIGWWEDGVDDTACASQPITVSFTADNAG